MYRVYKVTRMDPTSCPKLRYLPAIGTWAPGFREECWKLRTLDERWYGDLGFPESFPILKKRKRGNHKPFIRPWICHGFLMIFNDF